MRDTICPWLFDNLLLDKGNKKHRGGSMRAIILFPAETSIVLPVGYMDQPTGLLHVYL